MTTSVETGLLYIQVGGASMALGCFFDPHSKE